jgi:hypothetical protein
MPTTQHRIRALFALAIAASSAACNAVQVRGVVLDSETFDGIPGALVTYTNVNSNVVFSDTSVGPSGAYSIVVSEDTYLIDVTHPTCTHNSAPFENPMLQMFSPYTINLFMTCP